MNFQTFKHVQRLRRLDSQVSSGIEVARDWESLAAVGGAGLGKPCRGVARLRLFGMHHYATSQVVHPACRLSGLYQYGIGRVSI